MKSRFDYPKPEGRQTLFYFPQRLDPEKDARFPYEPIVAEPARWPAGDRWQARRRLVAPVRALARWIDRLLILPLAQLATLIEGQPLVWWCQMDGWREVHGYRPSDRRTSWWVYDGPITPDIRVMFAAHPERFADCSPQVLAALRAGQ